MFGHWVWNGLEDGSTLGWLGKLGFVDFAGSTVVHSVGGWAELTWRQTGARGSNRRSASPMTSYSWTVRCPARTASKRRRRSVARFPAPNCPFWP
ncbi:MAG: ammonium transporter [Planctomycetes bacterium]|nr:ammonium transporter [Planctomycetota bacterium]